MVSFKTVVVGFVLAIVAGCASVSPNATKPVATISVTHTPCMTEHQAGCVSIRIGNFAWDAGNALMQGLDKDAVGEEELRYRVQVMPVKLHQAHEDGQVRAGKPRAYFVLVFDGAEGVPATHLSAYQGRLMVRAHVADGAGKITPPIFEGRQRKLTGVYRFETGKTDAGVVTLQFPRSMVNRTTALLLCTEDDLSVYPNRLNGRRDGLWVMEETIQWMLDRARMSWSMFTLST